MEKTQHTQLVTLGTYKCLDTPVLPPRYFIFYVLSDPQRSSGQTPPTEGDACFSPVGPLGWGLHVATAAAALGAVMCYTGGCH